MEVEITQLALAFIAGAFAKAGQLQVEAGKIKDAAIRFAATAVAAAAAFVSSLQA